MARHHTARGQTRSTDQAPRKGGPPGCEQDMAGGPGMDLGAYGEEPAGMCPMSRLGAEVSRRVVISHASRSVCEPHQLCFYR